VEQLAQLLLAVADAGQVRRRGNLHLLIQLQHGIEGTVAGRATGTVGDREELGLLLGQYMGRSDQFFMTGFSLRREELEADGNPVVAVHILSLYPEGAGQWRAEMELDPPW